MEFVKLLKERGAKLFVADLNWRWSNARSRNTAPRRSSPTRSTTCRWTCRSCGRPSTINAETLLRLKAKVICGTANNQMSHKTGDEAARRGILYAPDYAINAGGVMNVSLEIDGYNRERAMRLMRNIYHTVGKIFELSEREGIAPQYAADRIAEARIASIGKLKLPLGRTAPRFMGHLRGEH